MHSFGACLDAENSAKLFAANRRVHRFVMEKHVKLDEVATVTEKVFITGCCECIGDIPDTVAQISNVAEAAIFTGLIDSIAKQLKRLEPSPLQEGVKA